MAYIKKIKEGTETIYPATIPQAVVDPTSGKTVRTELDERATSAELSQLEGNKVNKKVGKNIFNPSDIYKANTFTYDLEIYEEVSNSGVDLYIYNATQNLAINYTIGDTGMAHWVLDGNKQPLRRFTGNYVYQSSDGYIIFNVLKSWSNVQIEAGNVSTSYEPYTDMADVTERLDALEDLKSFEFDLDDLYFANPIDNGGILRKYGIDVPAGSTGSNSYLQVRLKNENIKGRFKVDVDVLHNDGLSLMEEWGQTTTSLGSGLTRISKTYNYELISNVVFPSNISSDTTKLRSIRVSRVYITPLDMASYNILKPYINNYSGRNIFEVSKYFNSTTNGWGVTRFANPVTCYEYIETKRTSNPDYYSDRNKITVRIMPGYYDEFETKWAGVDGETAIEEIGIKLRSFETWESFDLDHPYLTVLKWDGKAGFTGTMTTDQAMRRCIFHITNPLTQKIIRGFKIISLNTRYCVHPETAGSGYGSKWLLSNLLLDWGGRPNVDSEGGCHIGIGISTGEIGIIENVKCIGIGYSKGIGGHNNGHSSGNLLPIPFQIQGAKLTIKNSDLGGGDIRFQTYSNDAETFDILELDNVKNINTAEFYEDIGVTPNWRAITSAIQIVQDNLDR